MTDPITLTAGAIATLAFTKFLESAAGETGKKLTEARLKKMDTLRLAISKRFQGNPKVESSIVAIEQNGSQAELERLTKYLDVEMMDDAVFASEITAIAHEIEIDQSGKTQQFTAIIEQEGNGYVALCPELDIASEGDSVEEAKRNLIEALELFFEAASPSEIQRRLQFQSEVFITSLEVAVG
ncbi:type II toxin-antitoxin system HicB family antitoxin [Leptolyngbyaceae cyanobacterium UHCC 1019]